MGKGRGIKSLEVDSEQMSSLVGGGGRSGSPSKAPSRPDAETARERQRQEAQGVCSPRNLLLTAGLGLLAFVFFDSINGGGGGGGGGGGDSGEGGPPVPAGGFHGNSLGGVNNLGHPGGAKAHLNGEFEYEEIFVPVSNVGHAVKSISAENVLNLMGHYVHDEHRSPYASHLYARNVSELEEEQTKYEAKMAKVREEWGAWDFSDDYPSKNKGRFRPVPDFAIPYRDAPGSTFPSDSWQSDGEYVTKFLGEGKALVKRVREGIYAEFGFPNKKSDGTDLDEEERKRIEGLFRVNKDHDGASKDDDAVAVFTKHAWDGLVRKLLHAMMTNDEFYYIMGGHSAAAGHGNNFRQQYTMAFQYLMEPVFDRLGVRLISRNMAMGGLGTNHFSLASGSLYGEKDVILWDSAMTEKAPGSLELFQKQAVLGGERVPIIINTLSGDIVKDTNGTAWSGKITPAQWNAGGRIKDEYMLTDSNKAEDIPFFPRYMFCDKGVAEVCNKEKYKGVCWEPRSDVEPQSKQNGAPAGQAGWHPGWRSHLYNARMQSITMLAALDDALDKWKAETEAGGHPLADEYWHVGAKYREIQEALRTHTTEEPSECEKWLVRFPRVCRVAMKGFTEWTPRNNPEETSIRAAAVPGPGGYKPHTDMEELYRGIDVMSLAQRIPDGEVDVHAIAIATTQPAPELNHTVKDESDRRRLAKASEEAASSRICRAVEKERRLSEKAIESNVFGERERGLRSLLTFSDEVTPGSGWSFKVGNEMKPGFPDGSYNSRFGRETTSSCLMSGHNDLRAGLIGDALSGWLVLKLPKIKEGLVLARIEHWTYVNSNKRTEGWTDVNSGAAVEEVNASGGERSLKVKGDMHQPDDLKFEVAVNGKIVTSMDKDEFLSYGNELAYNFAIFPLMDDPEWSKRDWGDNDGEDIEIAIRLRSEEGRVPTLSLTHVYYA